MNTILLSPTDALFFRDGRPMDGGIGHGASWPMPHVINAAFHAALHRAGIEGVHDHRSGRSSKRDNQNRDQNFGSLVTAGPFPTKDTQWYFPRPADAQVKASSTTSLRPANNVTLSSSLKNGLLPVVNSADPSKDKPEAWMNQQAWSDYLSGSSHSSSAFANDSDISCADHSVGTEMNADTGTTEDGKLYSASYLRLKYEWKLGVLAEAQDKISKNANDKRDLITDELLNSEEHMLIGGQQRTCSASLQEKSIPLPIGPTVSGRLVRFTLFTPAIFPEIGNHPGGWLPSWIDTTHQVQLLDGPGKNKAQRMKVTQGSPINAKLVAAIIPRSIPVTGWSLGRHTDDKQHGAKSTHLAVPAGAVYYFEADSEEHAKKLADALNWHGTSNGSEIQNRRSSLMGEKGFGLGVCSNWVPHTT